MGKVDKIKMYLRDYGFRYAVRKIYYRYQIKYKLGKKYYPIQISSEESEAQENHVFEQTPCISIVVPLYNTPEQFLREMIETIQWQTYTNWELCLADASDENPEKIEQIVKEYQKEDVRILESMAQKPNRNLESRIKYRKLAANEGISQNTNAALLMATGEYIGLMDHDDLLHPSALYFVVREINEYGADFIYTDELSFEGTPDRVQSIHFKPDFMSESYRNNNYICHFTVFEKGLLEKTGRFRKEMDGSQDYDLFLRLTEIAREVRHVDKVLYYWRLHAGSSASGVAAKPYVVEAGRKAVTEHLKAKGFRASAKGSEIYGPFYHITYQVPQDSRLAVIVPNESVKEWVQKDVRESGYPAQIQLVNQNQDFQKKKIQIEDSAEYVLIVRDGYYQKRDRISSEITKQTSQSPECGVISQNHQTSNYEEINPTSQVAEQGGESQNSQKINCKEISLNEKVVADREANWVNELLQCLQPVENMVAAPIVYDASDKVYHAGYCYDASWNEKIRPLYRDVPKADPAYMNRLKFRQNVSLLGGAVILMKKSVFDALYSEMPQVSVFSDIFWFSACLQAGKMWGNTVITAHASFYTKESGKKLIKKNQENNLEFWGIKSVSETKWQEFFKRWDSVLKKKDPCFNVGMRVFGKYYFLWK